MLTTEQMEALSPEQIEAVLWADSFLWPAAQDYFEDWLVAVPDVAVPAFKRDPWEAFKLSHDWDQARQAEAKRKWEESERSKAKARKRRAK